jgi:hypothetical protein
MRGVQLADGPGYSISEIGPGFPAPACGEVPSGDDGFLFTFNNTNAAGTDLYLNFDWGAGNSGVTLDQVFVAPEPSVVGFLGFGIAAMLKRRRRYTRTRS